MYTTACASGCQAHPNQGVVKYHTLRLPDPNSSVNFSDEPNRTHPKSKTALLICKHRRTAWYFNVNDKQANHLLLHNNAMTSPSTHLLFNSLILPQSFGSQQKLLPWQVAMAISCIEISQSSNEGTDYETRLQNVLHHQKFC